MSMLTKKQWEMQLATSEYGDALRWLELHNPQQLEALMKDFTEWDIEHDPYFELMRPLKGWSVLGEAGIELLHLVEATFIQRLSREKAVVLARAIDEDGIRVEVVEGVCYRSVESLLRPWNAMHGEEKPIYWRVDLP